MSEDTKTQLKMPSIAQKTSPAKAVSDGSPAKKQKTDTVYEASTGLQLKWKITNRPDYHPLLRQPYGVTVTEDIIVTAEGLWPHSRAQIFNHNGHFQKVIGQGHMLPFDVTIGQDGNIIVSDHKDRTIKAFTREGTLAFEWDEKKFDWPNGIARTRDGNLVVADWAKGRLFKCDLNGREIQSFPTKLCGEDEMSCPDRVAVDTYGRYIVSDGYTSVVKVYNPMGCLLFQIGNKKGSGFLESPKGVAVAGNNILVSDWKQDSIKRYDRDGQWIDDLVTTSHSLKHPLAIAWDQNSSSVVVTEHQLHTDPCLKMFSQI